MQASLLLPDGLETFFSGHSPRNYLTSVAAALGFHKDERAYLGRWSMGMVSSEEYVGLLVRWSSRSNGRSTELWLKGALSHSMRMRTSTGWLTLQLSPERTRTGLERATRCWSPIWKRCHWTVFTQPWKSCQGIGTPTHTARPRRRLLDRLQLKASRSRWCSLDPRSSSSRCRGVLVSRGSISPGVLYAQIGVARSSI